MNELETTMTGQLFRLAQLLHRKQHRFVRTSPVGDSTRGQGRVMALLKLQNEMSQKDLGYLLGIRNQSVSELIAKLEKAGYVEKSQAEDDKRVVKVKLTEQGFEAANASEEKSQDQEDLFTCLTEAEQQQLSEYLGRLISELEDQMDDPAGLPDWWQSGTPDEMQEFFERFHHNHNPRRGSRTGSSHRSQRGLVRFDTERDPWESDSENSSWEADDNEAHAEQHGSTGHGSADGTREHGQHRAQGSRGRGPSRSSRH